MILSLSFSGIAILFQLLWTVVWGDLNKQIDRLESQSVKREEVRRIDDRLDTIDDRLTRMSDKQTAAANHLGDKYLTKDAYFGQHQALIEQVNRLQDRHNELRQDVGKITTPTDVFKDFSDRLRALENRIREAKP